MKPIAIAVVALLLINTAHANEGYFRAPSLHGELVVFTAEGDLWSYTLGDATAQRLTTHPSMETDAAISPDGTQVAFVADYEGTNEVYVMPTAGGLPKRLTFENSWVDVQGWTPEGDVLYSTGSRPGVPMSATLKTVDTDSLVSRPIPLADAVNGALAGDSESLLFTQFGLQYSGDNAVRYRGGMRGRLWSYQLGSGDEASRVLPDHEGSIRRPMIDSGTLYFISDASGRDNIWAAGLDGAGPRQVTLHSDFSVREADSDSGRIVYRLGADVWLMDTSSGDATKLDIDLRSDHPSMRESWINDPMEYLESVRISGDAERVTLTARGASAVAGTGPSRLATVAAPGDARLRRAVRSHDGEWIYAISDSSGEPQIWRYPASGDGEAEQMTQEAVTVMTSFVESPDGEWIAHHDGFGGLWILNTDTLATRRIVDDLIAAQWVTDIEWSPNSELLLANHVVKDEVRPRIMLYEVSSRRHTYLTSAKYEAFAPTFSRDGRWVFYLANRRFDASGNSVWQDRDFGPSFDQRTEIFAQPLTDDAWFPFRRADELSSPPEVDEEAEEEAVEVDVRNLPGEVWQVPVEPGDYTDIALSEEHLYVQATESDGSEIKVVALEPDPTVESYTGDVAAMQLSIEGDKLMIVKESDGAYSVFVVVAEATFPEDPSDDAINTAGWRIAIDPVAEWQQMFRDAWLMHRELFFDPAMRGLDWDAMREKYQPLADRITDRHELNDVLAQMMGELNTLHSQVRGGDVPSDPDAPAPATLGAELTQTNVGVVISRIYRHDPEVPSESPPLAMPGVDAADGDLISRVNGVRVSTVGELNRELRNQAGQRVLLELQRGRDTVRTIVVPSAANEDGGYRYTDWVLSNRDQVESAGGELGYVHLAAMGGRDVANFAREFYASSNKSGFIIDVRRNNGGNVDSWIIERLIRRAWSFWAYKGDEPYVNMQNAFRGHIVVLADERTYSDGETFTAAVKALDIGPVIGRQTAGAGVWLSGRNALSDGGMARAAEFPVYSMEGSWIVEGQGVSPTIDVVNLPHETFNGRDAQLETAIDYLLRKLEEEPVPDLVPAPFTDEALAR